MRFTGGKGNLYRKIINLIPPHDVYIETHLGGGAVLRFKKPASSSLGLDIDSKVVRDRNLDLKVSGCTIIKSDAADFLRNYKFKGNEFVYSDPPYVLKARRGGKIYKYEYTEWQHIELISILKKLKCCVMLSGYRTAIYDDRLPGWNKKEYRVKTRGGTDAVECLWMNYKEPTKLHDYSFLGGTFREREKIKRKAKRWVFRFNRMNELEREAIIEELIKVTASIDK